MVMRRRRVAEVFDRDIFGGSVRVELILPAFVSRAYSAFGSNTAGRQGLRGKDMCRSTTSLKSNSRTAPDPRGSRKVRNYSVHRIISRVEMHCAEAMSGRTIRLLASCS